MNDAKRGGAAGTQPGGTPDPGAADGARDGGADGSVLLPGHGSCYICGSENPAGLGVRFRMRENRVWTDFTLNERQQGPPGHAHGGCLSAVLDEAMGAAVWCAGHPVAAARLEVDFRKAVPLGAPLHLEAWVTSVEGRKIWAQSEIRSESGVVATHGRGLYIVARHVFDKDFFVPKL
jgi:acyl-coenzyme A thioesterase PaaI-like protein